ncbi:MAG: hypothetical protein PVS3B3_37230 [Ktedonobacteraceae bacterium]
MVNTFDKKRRWNIFARELEDILASRSLRITQLYDRGVIQHREKGHRLQRSLTSPKHLTTLNPTELENLITLIELTEVEQQRLRAALLATSVEMTLMDRIEADVAFMAANDVFTILFDAMRTRPDMAIQNIKGGAMVNEEELVGDALFLQALDLIDRATLTLHASKNARTQEVQATHAHEALAEFTRALELLKQATLPRPDSDEWQGWYNEAVEGCRMAKTLV